MVFFLPYTNWKVYVSVSLKLNLDEFVIVTFAVVGEFTVPIPPYHSVRLKEVIIHIMPLELAKGSRLQTQKLGRF